jgi:hypothetical protein
MKQVAKPNMNKIMFTKFVEVVRRFRRVEEEQSKTFPKYWFEGNTKQVYYCEQEKMYRYPSQQQSFYRLPEYLNTLDICTIHSLEKLRSKLPALRLVADNHIVTEDGTVKKKAMDYYAVEARVNADWLPISGVYHDQTEFSTVFSRNQSHLRKLLQDTWFLLV